MFRFRVGLVIHVFFVCSQGLGDESRPVRGTVNVPCRLYVQSDEGTFYFARSAGPEGTAVVYDKQRGASVEKHTTLSAHPFVVDLPPGRYTFTAERGKEYDVAVQTVTISERGDIPDVVLSLERWIDLAALGWFSGDTHVHRWLAELPNLVEAEDLHVALPITHWVRAAYERPSRSPGEDGADAQPIIVNSREPSKSTAVERVIWPLNTEYELFTVAGRRHTEGAVVVLNHQTPLRLAAPPVAPLAQAARDQRALLDLDKHSWNWSMMIVPIMNVDLYELANNHMWRSEFLYKNWTVDMLPRDWEIETDSDGYTEKGWIDWTFKNYYALLNCGFRLRPSAGTASGVHPVPLGFGRVYVECPGGFTYDRWIAGLDAGRSFVTTGPMLRVTFDGQPSGTVFGEARPHEARIAGTAEGRNPLTRIEVVVNGEVVRRVAPENTRSESGGARSFATSIAEQIPLEHSAWIAVRCFEQVSAPNGASEEDGLSSERERYAHTAPVHFEIDGPVRPRAREVNYFIERMEQEIARNRGVLARDEVGEYERALAIYREIAQRARP
mgnify:FL=1